MSALQSGAESDVELLECERCGDYAVPAQDCREGGAGACMACQCACCAEFGHTAAQCPQVHDDSDEGYDPTDERTWSAGR